MCRMFLVLLIKAKQVSIKYLTKYIIAQCKDIQARQWRCRMSSYYRAKMVETAMIGKRNLQTLSTGVEKIMCDNNDYLHMVEF